MPSELRGWGVKYWNQRHLLFRLFDEGVQLDAEGWFSVTPEAIAAHQAERLACGVAVDAFTGCGGNAIQLALNCHHVIAVDMDPKRLAMAQHNAHVYGVADYIDFVLGDFTQIGPFLQGDVVFLSPPWGGPAYAASDRFHLQRMRPTAAEMIGACCTQDVAIFLPRNADLAQVAALAGYNGRVEVEQNHVGGKLKSITAYYGDLVRDLED